MFQMAERNVVSSLQFHHDSQDGQSIRMNDSFGKTSVFIVVVDNVQFGGVSLHFKSGRKKNIWNNKTKENDIMIFLLSIIDVMFTASHRVFAPMEMELDKVETICQSSAGNER